MQLWKFYVVEKPVKPDISKTSRSKRDFSDGTYLEIDMQERNEQGFQKYVGNPCCKREGKKAKMESRCQKELGLVSILFLFRWKFLHCHTPEEAVKIMTRLIERSEN